MNLPPPVPRMLQLMHVRDDGLCDVRGARYVRDVHDDGCNSRLMIRHIDTHQTMMEDDDDDDDDDEIFGLGGGVVVFFFASMTMTRGESLPSYSPSSSSCCFSSS
mmetsp:Transcript_8937/g.22559  ORF Transcript_8937/g.22559 Transcript_8937/m.22559 type:complete len:105 (+) Transcript_8937:400-714(+)